MKIKNMYMKKNFILAVFCLIISAMAFAQVPQKMSYQAVVRGSDNNLVTNSEVSVRVSILQGSVDGEAVYTETHSATTNANGLLTIEIGDGTSSDDFSAINWVNGPFFVKTETDVNGGNDYDIIGVSQLLAVPYAMYAQRAGNVPDVSGFLTEETDPTVPEWAKAETKPTYNYNEIENTPEIPEFQALSISNDTIFLTNGGFVKLPPVAVGFSGDYNDLVNAPEIPTVPTNVSAFDNDANYLTEETDPSVPAWAKAETKPTYDYSEIQNTPNIPTIPNTVSSFENDANYLTSESDPTVPTWAKAETKPTYDYSEIQNTPNIPTIPNTVSSFENDANYLTSEADPTVPTWAKAETKPVYDYSEIANTPEIPTIPTAVSAFENDANYLTSETDPSVYAWAKAENKPAYDYSEITNTPEIPVVPTTVSAFDNDANYLQSETDPSVYAWAKSENKPVYDYTEIQNTPNIPTVPTAVSAFENDANYLQSESDPNVPAWAKSENKPVYDYSEIQNTPNIPTIPTAVSAFDNDANYLTSETDPSVPAWAKANTKPSYSYEEITGKPELFSGNYNDLTNIPTIPTVPTNVSAFENDANYLTSYTETQTLANVVALGNSAGNSRITNVANPTANQDAATKKYVDDLIATLEAAVEALQNRRLAYVTFDANGGVGSMQSQVFLTGAAQAISANAFTKENNWFAGWNTAVDGSGESYADLQEITIMENITLYAQWSLGVTASANGHDYVDLGLPSGTSWATCNVGASTPTAYGNYYAWGEITTKSSYAENNYTYHNNPATLPSSADAATANWGSAWRMPTKEEFEELKSNCTVTWITQNGVNGRLFTGPNGNSIFMPAAGGRHGDEPIYAGSGDYLSSSLYDVYANELRYAWMLSFSPSFYGMAGFFRYIGQSVRAVLAQ
jgi:hypothetical protein